MHFGCLVDNSKPIIKVKKMERFKHMVMEWELKLNLLKISTQSVFKDFSVNFSKVSKLKQLILTDFQTLSDGHEKNNFMKAYNKTQCQMISLQNWENSKKQKFSEIIGLLGSVCQ